MNSAAVSKSKTYDMVYIALFTVLMAVCSWISIPMAVPFTLQTFGVFAAVGVLGGRRGTISVLIYIILGIVGIPVFAGFKGGVGMLAGSTGGYIVGFLFSALTLWGLEKLLGRKPLMQAISMVAALVVCYAFGTAWFMLVYAKTTGPVGVGMVLGWCVVPFIIPDLVKIALALFVSKRVRRYVVE